MKRTHYSTLKTAKDNLYEEFLNSKGSKRMDLLIKIMEIDEDLEEFKKFQKSSAVSKNSKK